MAITVKNFATLVAYVQYMANRGSLISEYEIEDLLKLVKAFEDTPAQVEPTKVDLAPLFNAIYNNKKIEAIKEYRNLTNFGLKESKDEIERLMGTCVV